MAINRDYVQYFPAATSHNDAYRDFLSLTGTLMKEEARTSITLLSRSGDSGSGTPLSFVLKVYRYPHITRIRTIKQISIAEREYRGLQQCQLYGVPVAQPVGFGVERGLGGMVRSCFVVTRLVEDTVSFKAWLNQKDERKFERHAPTAYVMQQIGQYLRRLHENRFFLMRPAPKNILLRDTATARPQPLFIDLAYARSFPLYLAPQCGQRVDFGLLFGPFLRWSYEDVLEPFLEMYLPDPFGRTPAELRQFILRAARIHKNRTPLTWASHRIHRAIRHRILAMSGGKHRSGERGGS
ncbi:MAG: hypothetical protein JSV16_09725 [Candidatus Hydrogenedentota bacterium]|nr:MAG: hypothetical protein JSV16_09725 [Candidatus Hydrogenedentota bacterium]